MSERTWTADLESLAGALSRAFQAAASGDDGRQLTPDEQRTSMWLYRLLSEGRPVDRGELAQRAAVRLSAVHDTLDQWPGVYCDERRRVVGYRGLALADAYAGPHRLSLGGSTLAAWCAWDALFLPPLLRSIAEVESRTPSGETVRLRVSSERVESAEPSSVHVSLVVPSAAAAQRDFVTSFCHFVHFFGSREEGQHWIEGRDGAFTLSVHQAYALGRRKNQMLYPDCVP
jgi:alkylmercury lyase